MDLEKRIEELECIIQVLENELEKINHTSYKFVSKEQIHKETKLNERKQKEISLTVEMVEKNIEKIIGTFASCLISFSLF